SRNPMVAPKKMTQTKTIRDNSSETSMPELKPYRSTTFPNTSTTITARHVTTMTSRIRKRTDTTLLLPGSAMGFARSCADGDGLLYKAGSAEDGRFGEAPTDDLHSDWQAGASEA